MNLIRSRVLSLVLAATLAMMTSLALAQGWPTKPVVIIVAYPAGGDTDGFARLYAEKLSKRLGQPFLVDNKPGAGGVIGTAFVAKAPADGYTLLYAPSTMAIVQQVMKVSPAVAYDVSRDFTPVLQDQTVPLVLMTAPSTGIQNVAQLVAKARTDAGVTYGSPGSGSPMHIAAEMFNKAAGVSLTHVPYRGTAPMVVDAVGGQIGVGWSTPGAIAAFVGTGKLIPLAVAEPARSKALANVPTLAELGYDVQLGAWQGLMGPKEMPADIVRTLNRHMNEILKMPEVQARLATVGATAVGGEPSVLAEQMAQDDLRFGRLVKEFGIRAD